MLKYVCCAYSLIVLFFPAMTHGSEAKKIICEGEIVENCFRIVSEVPVADPNCPTKKGRLIEKIPNCDNAPSLPNVGETETAFSESHPKGGKNNETAHKKNQ